MSTKQIPLSTFADEVAAMVAQNAKSAPKPPKPEKQDKSG
jgi:hypothetical protein